MEPFAPSNAFLASTLPQPDPVQYFSSVLDGRPRECRATTLGWIYFNLTKVYLSCQGDATRLRPPCIRRLVEWQYFTAWLAASREGRNALGTECAP